MNIFARISAFLHESARLELISRQFKISIEALEEYYLPADPTGGKYLTWILRQIKGGNLRFPEDRNKVNQTLTAFDQLKKSPNFASQKDVNQYKTYGELAKVVRDASGDESQRSKADLARARAASGAKVVAELGEGMLVYEVTTHEAMLALGARDTEWCVKDRRYFNEYGPPFYMAVNDEGPQALLHLGSGQCMDVWDEPLEPDIFEKAGIDVLPTLSVEKILARLDEESRDWDDKRNVNNPEVKRIIGLVVDMIAKNQGRVAIENYDVLGAKNGLVQRLIHEYKVPLVDMDQAVISAVDEDNEDANDAYIPYAEVRGERWPWFERYIEKTFEEGYRYDVTSGVIYAINYKFRWPAVEVELIDSIKDGLSVREFNLALSYWSAVGEGRWEEAEPYLILTGQNMRDDKIGRNFQNNQKATSLAMTYNEVHCNGEEVIDPTWFMV